MYAKIARFAGPKLAAFGGQIAKNFGRVYKPGGKVDYQMIGGSLLPDMFFGGMAAMNTPGDLGDKGLAFFTDVALGGGASAAVRGLGGLRSRGLADKTGKVADRWRDQVGYMAEFAVPAVTVNYMHPVANSLIRMKHGGKSPLDIEMEKQDQAYRAGVIQQVMQELAAHGVRV